VANHVFAHRSHLKKKIKSKAKKSLIHRDKGDEWDLGRKTRKISFLLSLSSL
jgi:hypothetical protein